MSEAEVAILNSFDHHAPDQVCIDKIQLVRKTLKDAAAVIIRTVKPSADRTVSLRCLHEAMMNANKSLVLEKQPWGS